MAGDLLLGIDIGTGSLKLALIDQTAHLLAKSAIPYEILHPRPGWAEIDPQELWQAFLQAAKQLFAHHDPSAVGGIGVACLCPGLVAMDQNGAVLTNPILYSDRRSVAEAEYIKTMMPSDDFFALTANTPMSGAMSATSILWIKNHLPQVYAHTAVFGHLNTLFGHKMTGNFAIDRSNASYTGLFDVAGSREFSPLLCEKAGISIHKLPKVLGSEEVVGLLSNPDLLQLGLPRGIPVVAGGGDTACASLAAGIVKAGDICESAGTTNVLTVCVDKPHFHRAFINRCHVVDGTWIYQGAISHAGSSLTWFKDTFCDDLRATAHTQGKDTLALMDQQAAAVMPGANGIVFLPYMQGERSPIWDSHARGIFFGMSLETTRADMLRAVLESCGYGQRQLITIAEEVASMQFSRFSSLGGGAKSEIWAQIKADITGKDIDLLHIKDAAPVGAALLAGVGAGIFPSVLEAANRVQRSVSTHIKSDPSHKKIYDTRFAVYSQLYPRVKELFLINQEE
ncbi:FGGY family carbohydrate kinase [Oscillospiraceae bacterium MB08-C2-2]|nr:FGGY family carbohydrate kinase [Oscillospiraceae bacterium MB08-C2-2]